MASLGISEFTFGFAFLHEQAVLQKGKLRSVPILPSLQAEAEQGWDAHLPLVGTDFYYQFKLADRLIRSNAKEWKRGFYHSPYFRFGLHRRECNRQHRILCQHAISNPSTYYVAPEFSSYHDFEQAFLAGQVTANSRMIPLNQCRTYPATDSSRHVITFQENDPRFIQFSEPHYGEKSESARNMHEIYESSRSRWREIDIEFAEQILHATKEKLSVISGEEKEKIALGSTSGTDTVPIGVGTAERGENQLTEESSFIEAIESLKLVQVERTVQAMLTYSARILSVFFGMTLVIVGERPEAKDAELKD